MSGPVLYTNINDQVGRPKQKNTIFLVLLDIGIKFQATAPQYGI